MLSQHQERYRLGVAIAQVHNTALCVAVVIEMRQATPTGILHLVLGHLKTQAITIKLQRTFEIADTESDMRYR
jgi:hypothetical protein